MSSTSNKNLIFRVNNFDLLRLFAATQVAISHSIDHFKIDHDGSVLFTLLSFFPGVPIFFFISGFLISRSYEKNSIISEYAQNRGLRIFPALYVCTFLAILSVYLTGYFADRDLSISGFIVWILSQITFVQFYNPDFMRGFGTGVLNGSLWSISVELQFYILIPIVYHLFGLARKASISNRNLIILILIFLPCHIFQYNVPYFKVLVEKHFLVELWGLTFLPWFWMFLVGVFFQKNFDFFHKLLADKFFIMLPIYLIAAYITIEIFGLKTGNGINQALYILLALTIFSFAYSKVSLSEKLLKGNDISYGVYIYHMPIINLMLYYGFGADKINIIYVTIGSIVLGALSWFILERHVMKLKKHPLNPLNKKKAA